MPFVAKSVGYGEIRGSCHVRSKSNTACSKRVHPHKGNNHSLISKPNSIGANRSAQGVVTDTAEKPRTLGSGRVGY
jgi:hypothetical protein